MSEDKSKCVDCDTEYEVEKTYCPIDVADSALGKLRLCDIDEVHLCEMCYRARETQT